MFNLECNDDPNEFLPPRKAYQTNPLLCRSQVGHAPHLHSMNFPPDRVFGKVEVKVIDGAKQALSEWSIIKPKVYLSKGKDFLALNRDALKQGVVSAAATAEFRRQHPGHKQSAKKSNNSDTVAKRQKPPPQQQFDRPAGLESHHDRPATPISAVISGVYQLEWESKQRSNMSCWKKTKAKGSKITIHSTHASRGHAAASAR